MSFYYNDTEVTSLYYNDIEVTDMYYNDVLVFTNQRYKWWKFNVVTQNVYSEYYVRRTGNPFYIKSQSTKAMSSKPSIVNGKFDMSGGSFTSILEGNTPVGTYCAANSDSMRIVSSEDDSVRYPDYYGIVQSISNVTYLITTGANAVADIYGIQNNPRYGMGSYVGEVRSSSASAYPSNGIQDGYWYVSQDTFYTLNTGLNRGGTEAATGYSITGFVPVPDGCTRVSVYGGGTRSGGCILNEYSDQYAYLSYWNHSTDPRTFNLDYPGSCKFVRGEFVTANIGSCYIYDETHGLYLYRGHNV